MKSCPSISPLPFQPPFPRAPVSLAAHVSDTSDPHRTLDLVPTLSRGSGAPSAPGTHAGDVYVDSSSGGLWFWDGASWLRVLTFAAVATSGSYSDLAGRPVKTSDLTNDGDGQSPFAKRSDLAELVGGAPEAFDTLKEVAEWIGDDQSGAAAMAARIASLESRKADSAGLAAVATSGSYSDLTGRPTIPAAVTVDSALSTTSTNPVQNKVVTGELASKLSNASAMSGFTDWMFEGLAGSILVSFEYRIAEVPGDVDGYYAVVSKEGLLYSGSVSASESATSVTVECHGPDDEQIPITFTATRTRFPTVADLALKADKSELRYAMVTPIQSLATTDDADDTAAVQLQDRAMNQVTLGAGIAYATLTFPAKETGKARDFFVRLTITGADVPTLYFKEQGGASVAFDVDDDSWAEIEQGVNVLMFSDTSEESD